MSRGRLITLEGSEGVGKSTNLDVVCKFLEEKRIRFYSDSGAGWN